MRQNKKGDKRERIMKEALAIFANKGYHTSTIDEIARASGVAKGSVYNYFESKEILLRTLVFETLEETAEMMDPDHDGIVTVEEFFGMIRKSKKWLVENRDFLRLYFSVITQPKVLKMLEKDLWEIISPYIEKMKTFFKEHGFSDPETEVRFFYALLDGIEINYVLDPENFPLDKIEERVIRYYEGLLK
ncbi:TetR/AcrR family transcriptional regulator [Anaerophaga thermohalophila]|uniref:TetR/AcrR family transcriptional regulator n=1 Tax=Anaerophaga thermohalophila TaxID=177400 RepID=UPI0002E0652E|nr:TetR/AcrR family transcriptional regulator [Anaerophaga thermohalophila]